MPAALIVFTGLPVHASTSKCGAICTETWDLAGSPYVVTCDTTVGVGCTLTVDAGVEIRFQAATDLTTAGAIDVNGTSVSPVVFTSDSGTPAAGDWDFLDVIGSGGGTIDSAVVEYADRGLYLTGNSVVVLNDVTVRHSNYGIWADQSPDLTLQNVTVEQSTFDGMLVRRAIVGGAGNAFVNNGRYGVHIQQMDPLHSLSLRDGEIHSNGSLNVYGAGAIDVSRFFLDFRNNWWGTAEPSAIGATIRDHTDGIGLGVVDRCGYLDGPGGVPAVDAHCPDLTVCDGTSSLSLTDKPYLMTGDMIVCPTGTLEVGPGVSVLVDPDPARLKIQVDGGSVDVNGTAGSEASIRSRAPSPAPADWDGFEIRSGSGGTLDFAVVEHAEIGLYATGNSVVVLNDVTVRHNNYGIWVDLSPDLSLQDVTVEQSTFDGILVRRAIVGGAGNAFVNNGRYGVHIQQMDSLHSLSLRDGEIHSNGSLNVYGAGAIDVSRFFLDFRANWWGTADPGAIGAMIRDHTDSVGLGVVDRCGYLDGPGGLPAVDAHCPDLTVCDGTSSLSLTDKPYLMSADMIVCPTGTLEAGPGVAVLVDPDPALLRIAVEGGSVDVHGAAGSEATFTSRATSPAPGDWDGFDVGTGASVSAAHATVRHAERAFYLYGGSTTDLERVMTSDNRWGVYATGAGTMVTLFHVAATQNAVHGLHADGPVTVRATGCVLTGNAGHGVDLNGNGSGTPDFALAASALHSNLGGHDFYTASWFSPGTSLVRATDNWWGTTDFATIRARIFDHEDSALSPRVYHRAFGEMCDFAIGEDGDGDGLGDFEDNCPVDSNADQADEDSDGTGNTCDPDPASPPTGACDGADDVLDGYADADGDGWGDPCDTQPVRSDSHPGATELCDGRDNDGDGLVAAGELVDDDLDEGMACGDCDDSLPEVNACVCETCTNIIDDDCNGFADGADPVCLGVPTCLRLDAGPEPTLTLQRGVCGIGNPSGPFDVIRGELAQVADAGGSIDLGNVECVADGLPFDRVTDISPDPTGDCEGTLFIYYLARNAGDAVWGTSGLGQPRDLTSPDPACP